MKCLIIYVSVEHGNTEKVARTISEAIGAELKEVKDVDPTTIANYELIGFGSGIFKGKFHARLLKLVSELPQTQSNAFIFSTSGFGTTKYHEDMRKMLEGKGYRVVGDFACKGWDTYGPFKITGGINKKRPDQADLNAARDFAKTLKV